MTSGRIRVSTIARRPNSADITSPPTREPSSSSQWSEISRSRSQAVCKTPEEFKAWSQNLGHDKVLTTFLSYGQVESPRQRQIIRGLATPQVPAQADVSELARALVREMRGGEW